MRKMRGVFVGWFAFTLGACASGASAPERVHVPDVPVPVEVSRVEAAPEIPDPPSLPLPPRPDDDPETIPLRGAWAATFGHTASFSDAMLAVEVARRAWLSASRPLFTTTDAGLPEPMAFQSANQSVDLLNRRLAAAYYAPDAMKEERLRVLYQAASMLLGWAERLDQIGLATTPASYRADRRLALTFEEVAEGPAKRWRSEGYQLSKLCAERAAADQIDNPETRSCRTLHEGYRRIMVRGAAPPPKTPAPPECACPPGDPLCSATMSGWCRPVR